MPPAILLPTLHDSAREGNLEGVQALLGTGVDVNLVDNKYGKTPLCWATEYGQREVAKILLNHGADFNLADSIGRKPLLCAARHGYKSIAQLLLDRGDTVTSKDKNGRNALSLAAREGHIDVVRLLISFGDDVNSKDIVNQTPLSFAAKNGHLEIVLLLLDKGADPNSMESSNNRSPLLFAAMNGYVDIVRLLVARNAKIDSKDSDGRTPLSWAAANGDDEMVQFLLVKGADVNSKDNYDRTPLSHASEFGHTAAAKTLLKENGVEYDVQDTYYDQTPLSWASEGGHDEIVGMLLDKEVEVDSQDRAGHTPLLWAIRNGHDAVVELLLQKDVDVIMKNEDDWSPLSWAAHLGNEPLTRRLLSKAVDLNSKIGTAIAEAIESTLWRANGSLLDAKKSLEQAKKDPSLTKDPFFGPSKTEIQDAQEELARAKANLEAKHATVLKHEAVVNLIIERDEYLNIKDYKERTLLSWAAENGHDDVLELLLSRELSPDSTDQLYRTPISWAAREGHESTLIILIDRNVNPDWRDGAGRTPLSLAAEKGHQDVVKLLLNFDAFLATRAYALPLDVKKKPVGLYTIPQDSSDNLDPNETGYYDFERGVDIDSRDNSGQTPLEFAVKEGHGKVVDLLLDKGANMDTNRADNKSLCQLIDDELNAPETDKLKAANLIDVRILLEKRLEYGLLLTDPIEKNAPVDRKFKATIVYFLTKGEGVRERSTFQRYNIYDLMKGKNLNDLIATRETTCKWLHVPVNNMRWIEILMAQHYRSFKDPRTHDAHSVILRKELWTRLQHRAPEGIHHARFMRPTCQTFPTPWAVIRDGFSQETIDVEKGFVLYMPYLHWEIEDNVDEMKATIRQYEMAKERKQADVKGGIGERKSYDYQKNKELVEAYLDDEHPLHIRRTLDQFYYHTLKDTDARDKDQAGARYHKNHKLKNSIVLTMVDQLWLWVLPGNENSPPTVITSFPQRSNRVDSRGRRNDEKQTSLFKNIIAQSRDRQVENGHGLAEIIANECSRIYFDTMTDRDRSLQFLEIYATSIGDITDKETKCFKRFQDTLNLHNLKDEKVAEDTLNITEEIELLQEVKDIRDELNIMLSVFNAQHKALKEMAQIMYKPGTVQRHMSMSNGSLQPMESGDLRTSQRAHDNYPLPLITVESNIIEVKEMDKYAERAYMALNHLLDLKQKQANVLEARATHKLSDQANIQATKTVELTMATSSQGKMITFFTLITIVFLPLSFMAAFFAINIAEFPRDADGLSLGYVSKYMFSISAAIIVPSIIIAFHLENIENFLFDRKPKPDGAGPRGIGEGVGDITLQGLDADGKRKQKLSDEEQGRESANSPY